MFGWRLVRDIKVSAVTEAQKYGTDWRLDQFCRQLGYIWDANTFRWVKLAKEKKNG